MEPTNPNSPEKDPPAAPPEQPSGAASDAPSPDSHPASRKTTQLRRDSEPDDPGAVEGAIGIEHAAPAEPAGPTISGEELARRQAVVQAARPPVVGLFTGSRPKPAAFTGPLDAYLQ